MEVTTLPNGNPVFIVQQEDYYQVANGAHLLGDKAKIIIEGAKTCVQTACSPAVIIKNLSDYSDDVVLKVCMNCLKRKEHVWNDDISQRFFLMDVS